MIKHLVLSGGGHSLFHTFGALRYLQEKQIWKKQHIESIYGTSAGGLVGALMCLQYDYDKEEDWNILQKYLVERPWHDAFPLTTKTFIDSYSKRGLFDRGFVETVFKPLFLAKDISMNVTMQEFYQYSNIDLHLFAFELHKFEIVDISHETHADLPLLTALHMTSAFPIIFSPHISDDGKCYLDGGVKSNYPLDICIQSGKKEEEILGIHRKKTTTSTFVLNNDSNSNETASTKEPKVKKEKENKKENKKEKEATITIKEGEREKITNSASILDYILVFVYKLIKSICTENKQPTITNDVTYSSEHFSYFHLKKCLTSREYRQKYIDEGKQAAQDYYNTVVKN
ncbi:MAG: patatin-like phospholipase family protein [Crocinitomicaceae bacterium]|nr:patatin-like phospholipase family protein [Crocinitomicaceae bacterium]